VPEEYKAFTRLFLKVSPLYTVSFKAAQTATHRIQLHINFMSLPSSLMILMYRWIQERVRKDLHWSFLAVKTEAMLTVLQMFSYYMYNFKHKLIYLASRSLLRFLHIFYFSSLWILGFFFILSTLI
jgi:hypothetical protein